MIISNKITIKISNKTFKYYKQFHENIKIGDNIDILPTQLSKGSGIEINVKCNVCGKIKSVKYYDYNKITKNNTEEYYCKNCKQFKTKKTLNKIGVDNVFQLESVKKKIKETCKEKYGVEHHLQNKTILNKLKETNNERYGVDFIGQLKKYTKEEIIDIFNKIHNNLYIYDKMVYKGVDYKIKIKCTKHGYFEQLAIEHYKGCGCPKCKTSKGENKIIKLLDKNNIKYIHQKKFNDCTYKNNLMFDFYLPEKNICIEYDGIQHFKPIKYFGGINEYNIRKKKDEIKNKYCKENNIKLIRISYLDDIKNELIKYELFI